MTQVILDTKPIDETIRIENQSVLHGTPVEGYQVAFNKETKMAGVVRDGVFFPTLPLNAHRARDLAEELFGKRTLDEWWLDRVAVVNAKQLQELPSFDRYNQSYADRYTGLVIVNVVYSIPNYGVHIRVSQI